MRRLQTIRGRRGWIAGLRRSVAGWRWLAKMAARRPVVRCAFDREKKTGHMKTLRSMENVRGMEKGAETHQAAKAVFMSCGKGGRQ